MGTHLSLSSFSWPLCKVGCPISIFRFLRLDLPFADCFAAPASLDAARASVSRLRKELVRNFIRSPPTRLRKLPDLGFDFNAVVRDWPSSTGLWSASSPSNTSVAGSCHFNKQRYQWAAARPIEFSKTQVTASLAAQRDQFDSMKKYKPAAKW